MSESAVRVLARERELEECEAKRFRVVLDGVQRDAFVVRWRGRLYAYVNSCRHQSLPLDFGDAHFFDEACDRLVCCHHGARFEPATGLCTEGPCRGASLTPLALDVRDGAVYCTGRAPKAAP